MYVPLVLGVVEEMIVECRLFDNHTNELLLLSTDALFKSDFQIMDNRLSI